MVEFRSPSFAKLSKKLERAQSELAKLAKHAVDRRDAILSDDWEAATAAATGLHNVYNGIEDILLNIAKDVDGSVPEGSSMHQDLLDQMAVEIPDLRYALLSDDLLKDLTELKGFRHLVRHRYGMDLIGSKVMENVQRMERTFPEFVVALEALENALLAEPDGQNDPDTSSVTDPFKRSS
jgi:hypothetical protein